MKFTLACLALLTATSVHAQATAPNTVTTPVTPMPSAVSRAQPVAPAQPVLQQPLTQTAPSMQPVGPTGTATNSPLADPGRHDPAHSAQAPAAKPHRSVAHKAGHADTGSEPHVSAKKTAAAKKAKKTKKAGKKTAKADAADNTLADAGAKAAKPAKSRRRLVPNDGSRP